MPMVTTEDYDHGNTEEKHVHAETRRRGEEKKEKGSRVEKKKLGE